MEATTEHTKVILNTVQDIHQQKKNIEQKVEMISFNYTSRLIVISICE